MRNVIWGVIEPWLQCASRAPGTTGMRPLFFTKEIYFAVSEIRPFPTLVRGFERQLPYALSDGFMRLLDVLGVCE